MDAFSPRNVAVSPASARVGERRSVPGSVSKGIFAHEAAAMAPGLQSNAL